MSGFTVSAKACGVVPVIGATVMKFDPPAVVAAVETVKAKGDPELVI